MLVTQGLKGYACGIGMKSVLLFIIAYFFLEIQVILLRIVVFVIASTKKPPIQRLFYLERTFNLL